MDEFIYGSAASLALAIRQKKISAVEAVAAFQARIGEVNGRLNAVVQHTGERAEAGAQQADAALARGEIRGPLHGVPITLKDSIDTAGVVTTGGTKGRAGFVPDEDSAVASRLRAAGAILLGKTNTPELTLAGETNNLIYGQTNNPYDLSRTPGGSSGGAGAIVASGGSPLDMGSDTGGSIRIPAHFCGIAGLKPTSGRVPRTGHIIPYGLGAFDSLTQIGPLARFVEDLALALPIISGPDWRDPAIVPMPLGDPAAVRIDGLRVAMHTDNGVLAPTHETIEVVEAAGTALAALGVTITERRPDVLKMVPALNTSGADGRAWTQRLLDKAGTTEKHPWLQRRFDEAEPLSTAEFTALLEKLDSYRSDMLAFMESYDAILCPASAFPAPEHGGTFSEGARHAFTYTGAYNMTGWPAAVVRGGTSPEGLPIGVQVVARPWREDVALALAARLEAALGGWQRPPL
jgi:amidase